MAVYADLNLPSRLLLGAGPSTAHPRVLRAMSTPLVGHLDPQLFAVMDEIQEMLRAVFEAPDAYTLAISGTGTAGMEASLANFIEEGDTVLICVKGFFGERMADMAARYGATVRRIDVPWGEVFHADQIRAEFAAHPAKLVALVHAETSTGVLQPLEEIAEVAHRHGALLLADTVTSLGGVPVRMQQTGIDIAYSGSQKCLSAPPGLAPLALSPRALEALKARREAVSNWYLDLSLIMKYWGPERIYHHTAPISMYYALREALRLVIEEGLPARFERHARNARLLWDGLSARDLTPFVPLEYRLPPLTTVRVPDGIDEAAVRRRLLEEYNIEIAGGLGVLRGRVWRIGLMGYSSRAENIITLLGALERILA